MPVDEKKNRLRSVLEDKSTEELEELLALDFSEQEDVKPNVEYIMTILEVIHEREGDSPEKQAEVDAAWREFQEFIQEEEQAHSETGTTEQPILDHPCKTEYGQASRKRPRVLRYCAVVAAVIVLFCGTAYAFQWNVFQALADWTEETFAFLTGGERTETPEPGVFEFMSAAVARETDTPVVPKWAPEGTVQSGEINVEERSDKVRIRGTFSIGKDEFTVRISIYENLPEDYVTTYQKDDETVQVYESGGIAHYIMNNKDFVGATWVNGNVEGSIQGDLQLDEIKRMIDSIYEG